MQKILQVVAVIAVFGGLMLFNRYALTLGQAAQESVNEYYIQRIIMAVWLALAGFVVELPRIYRDLSQPGGRFAIDWAVLLVLGLPALALALLPILVAGGKVPVPLWLLQPNALPAEVIGAFLFGLSVGKSIIQEEYRVF